MSYKPLCSPNTDLRSETQSPGPCTGQNWIAYQCANPLHHIKGLFREQKFPFQQSNQREISLVYTKLQEAKMWAGKCLEQLGSELPPQYTDKAE